MSAKFPRGGAGPFLARSLCQSGKVVYHVFWCDKDGDCIERLLLGH